MPQTAPIMVALHFLPVRSTTAVIRMPRKKCSGYPTCVTNETMPAETMYSAEKSPMIASAWEEVALYSKNNFRKSLAIDTRLSFVLSVKNHPEICGNHNHSCNLQLLTK